MSSVFQRAPIVRDLGRGDQTSAPITVEDDRYLNESFVDFCLSTSVLSRSRMSHSAETRLSGSERQSGRVLILSSFLESNKFSLGDGHALRFQQQVVQILVPPASSEQRLDIAIDGLYHPETNLHAAVIENSTEMID
jgi:hypothetical protein